jgi:hypothetical protein
MWQEYTRQVPARRGLGLAMAAAALAASVMMAWSLKASRAEPSTPDRRVHLRYWPVSFELPAAMTLVEAAFEPFGYLDTPAGRAFFVELDRATGRQFFTTIAFELLDEGATLDDALERFPIDAEAMSGDVPAGDLVGTMLKPEPRPGEFRRTVVAVTPDGLAVIVDCQTILSVSAADRMVRRLAASLRLESWHLPKEWGGG